jgi:hypothetical protein
MQDDWIYEIVVAWQSGRHGLQLTCERNRRHRPLVPVISGGIVELWCLDCDYIQNHIPEIVTGICDLTTPSTKTHN